jgi:iron complex outermembrane receptor protein
LIDETALSYSTATANGGIDIANLGTYDLNRVEVLRGPQGTIYGAAAEGGVIKYVTNAPKLDRLVSVAAAWWVDYWNVMGVQF